MLVIRHKANLNFKTMKKMKYIFSVLKTAVIVFLFTATSCQKDDVSDEYSLSRRFAPPAFRSTNGETQVTLEWLPSLFTIPGEVEYVLEISDNPDDFTNPVYTATVTDPLVVVTDEVLDIRKDYFARVKALGKDKTADSNWLPSAGFRIQGEQFLLPVTTENVIDKSVRLSWKKNPDLSKVVITDAAGQRIEIALTDADKTTATKQVDNLSAGKL